jgi:hypothetical protein
VFCQLFGFQLILHVGAVVSTTTSTVLVDAAFLFVALSATLSADNVNFTFPFFPVIHLYTIVNVLLDAVHHAVTLSIVTNQFVAIVNAPLVKLVVLTHAHVSAHVTVILPVAHAFTYTLLGSHHVQLGFVVSIFSILLLPLYVTFHTLSTALKHTYVLLSFSLLNVNVVHAVYAFVAVLHVALVHVL